MERKIQKISRTELYRQVWENPITQLAKRYGLSDVGFAKICKKYDIPRPSRGYWAKRESGQKLPIQPLPRRSADELIEICPSSSSQLMTSAHAGMLQKIKTEKMHKPIVVPKILRNPHPLVEQSSRILELCQPDDVGILEPAKNCLDIRVSRKSLPRALRIINALITALLDRNFEVFNEDRSLKVVIDGEILGVGISEDIVIQKTQPKETDLDGRYHFGHSIFDTVRVPSGRLCLMIHLKGYYYDKLRKSWRDTEKRQLESMLDAFIIGLIKKSGQIKEYKRQEEEQERQRRELACQREEQQQLRAELAARIQREKARLAKLVMDAENYQKSGKIRDFIAAVERERQKGNSVYVPDEDYEAWVKWAREQVERLNPLSKNPPSVLDDLPEANEKAEKDDEFRRW